MLRGLQRRFASTSTLDALFRKTTAYSHDDVLQLVTDARLPVDDEPALVGYLQARMRAFEPAWLSEDSDPEVPAAERAGNEEHPAVWLQSIRRELSQLQHHRHEAAVDGERLRRLDGAVRRVLADEWLGNPAVYAHRVRPTEPELLETLRDKERVHPTDNADAFLQRALPPRRIFSLEHPAVGRHQPAAFVCTALVQSREREACSIPYLLSLAPWYTEDAVTTAIFYSISLIEPGLAGVGVAKRLLRAVLEQFTGPQQQAASPLLRHFLTLSPMPKFRDYLAHRRPHDPSYQPLDDLLHNHRQLSQKDIDRLGNERAALQPLLQRAAVRYLLDQHRHDHPTAVKDSPAAFHFANGAALAAVHFLADPSRRRMHESLGVMVNYEYQPELMEERARRYQSTGQVDVAPSLHHLL